MTIIFAFDAWGEHYRIVPTDEFPWRSHFGFRPKQPYLLVDDKGYSSQAVTEADLLWYRTKYGASPVNQSSATEE